MTMTVKPLIRPGDLLGSDIDIVQVGMAAAASRGNAPAMQTVSRRG